MTEDEYSRRDLGVRVAGVFLPTVVTAHFLAVWLPKPVAWASSIVAWNLIAYLIRPKPQISLKLWLLIVSVITMATVLVAVFDPTLL